jgi:predicted transcriptional regulator
MVKKVIHFVNNPAEIKILANFRHQEILQLLTERPMTETQLSHVLGLTKSAIGYHLKKMQQANLIYLEKVEAERHGILQKFYSPIASLVVPTHDNTPNGVKRYFIQIQIEHLIGMLAAIQCTSSHFLDVHSEIIEELAVLVWKQLEQTGKKYETRNAIKNDVSVKITIYADVLNTLTALPEWQALLP